MACCPDRRTHEVRRSPTLPSPTAGSECLPSVTGLPEQYLFVSTYFQAVWYSTLPCPVAGRPDPRARSQPHQSIRKSRGLQASAGHAWISQRPNTAIFYPTSRPILPLGISERKLTCVKFFALPPQTSPFSLRVIRTFDLNCELHIILTNAAVHRPEFMGYSCNTGQVHEKDHFVWA